MIHVHGNSLLLCLYNMTSIENMNLYLTKNLVESDCIDMLYVILFPSYHKIDE